MEKLYKNFKIQAFILM